MPGLFVTFEGGEGSGKSTQIDRLAARLRVQGSDPVVTREPGGTPLAERIRELIMTGSGPAGWITDSRIEPDHERLDASPLAMSETFLLEAARADLVAKVIRPALEAGRVVLCDRYDDSTLAYQGGGRRLDVELLSALNRAATGGLRPDVTFLFDLDPAEGLKRRSGAGGSNRLDREPQVFHVRVRDRYLELARREPERFVVLDAAGPADNLETQIWSAVETRMGRGRAAAGRDAVL